MESLALGIDIGGTNTVFGIIDQQGRICHKLSIATQAKDGGERLMARILETARGLIAEHPVQGIGVGSPGQIDPTTASCAFANENLPGWTGMPIARRIHEALGLPVKVENDANVAALAEYRFGAGKGVGHLICLTLGTGVGGGVIIDGKLLIGATGRGAELGHIVVRADGPHCPCGMNGCLETYASATGIVRMAGEALATGRASSLKTVERLSAKAVFAAAAAGDSLADQVVAEASYMLAVGIAGLQNLFDPQLVLLGGGVSLAGQPLIDRVQRHLESWPMTRGRARLDRCALGDDAGVIGAAALVLPHQEA